MAVKIRLRRMGNKKNPFYRIVVADSRSPRDGRIIEELGYYNPLTDPTTFKVDNEKAVDWISKGAKPTDVVDRLFNSFEVYSNGKAVAVEEKEETEEKEVEVKEEAEVEEAPVEEEEETEDAAEEAEEN